MTGGLLDGLGIFQQEDLELFPQEVGHTLLDEAVIDRFFRLVFIGGLGGEVVGNENQGLLNIHPSDFRFVLGIFPILPQPAIQRREKGGTHRLFGCPAMLQPGGVVVMLDEMESTAEAERTGELDFIIGLVRPIPTDPLALPKLNGGVGLLSDQLLYIVCDAVFVGKAGLLKALLCLGAQTEHDPGIDHCLSMENIGEKFGGDIRLGKDLQIGQPSDGGTRLLAVYGGDFQIPHQNTPFKMQVIAIAVSPYNYIHKAGGILCGTGAQAI